MLNGQKLADPALRRIHLIIVEPTLRVVSTAPRMALRRLASEARPNQRLQRTSAASAGPLGSTTPADGAISMV